MTEDLKPASGRVFVGVLYGSVRLVTVRSVRHRKDGTPSSCVLYSETDIAAEYNVSLPKSGELTGFRRVTLATLGTAQRMADLVGETVPTDAVVIVTRDRVGADGVVVDPKGIS